MIIGVPKETKNNEHRVALTPNHVRKLLKLGHEVLIEKNAGTGAGFSDSEYVKAGAEIKKSVKNCEMIVRVKPPATVKKRQIIMAYLHIEKGQNPVLLHKLLRQKATSYAYEEIRNTGGKRMVNLGYEAGVVGMYEGLRFFLKSLKSINEHKNMGVALNYLKKQKFPDIKVYIMGKGNVAKGAQKVLKLASIKANVLYRDKTKFMTKYLPRADILVNAIKWTPDQPHLVKTNMLKLMKKTALIVDISCDKKGGVETCIPTTWSKPTYKVDGITHFCVDNLPAAIPHDASVHLSKMILPHVIKVANNSNYAKGLMTQNGVFVYKADKF